MDCRRAGAKLLCAAISAAMVSGPVAALAQNAGGNATNPFQNIPVHGVANTDENGQKIQPTQFNGTFSIESFQLSGDQIVAVGTLTGDLGGRTVTQAAALPVMIPGNGGRGPQGGFGGS